MKYKDFVRWCNERACDSCWGFTTATMCIAIMAEVNSAPFWKRKKVWDKLNADNCIEEQIVNPVNKLIEEFMKG